MIRLLQWLILGHIHKWKELHRYELHITNPYTNAISERGTRIECICEKCGSHRKFDLK